MGSGADFMTEEEEEIMVPDMVNHPPHYNTGGIECIEYIHQVLGKEGFVAYLRGNIIKYNHRLLAKGNAAQDSGKLAWYSERLAKELNRV